MKEHPRLNRIGLMAATMCLLGLLPVAAATRQPNIIFILADDMGYGDLGKLFQNGRSPAHPAKKLSTPELDTMASAGMIFNRHYCPAPVCAPSRASLLLGVHQGHANVRDRQFDKALAANHTLASTLKAAGYYTAAIGKWGVQGAGRSPLDWPAYPTKRGFDYFYGYVRHIDGHQHYPGNTWPLGDAALHQETKQVWENTTEVSAGLDKCYTTDLFTARAKKLIMDESANNPTRPFFIYLAYDTPHAALQLPTVAYPAGKGIVGGLQWKGTAGNMINTATGTIDSHIDPLYSGHGWPNKDERFATMITRIDHCVGDLLQTLKDLGIADNTIVIFSSDNGPHEESYISRVTYWPTAFQSYGPLEGIKQDCYEGGIRVPTLAWGPGHVQVGVTNNTPSQFHDWLPTFCDYAGVPAPARTDGVSLVPILSGSGTQKAGTVYIEYYVAGSMPTYSPTRAFPNHGGNPRNQAQVIYLDGYKGIRTGIASPADNFRIYDTLTDLKEATNLAETSPYFIDLQQRMKNRVLQVRRPDSSASRPYDSALVPAVTVSNVVAGLDYRCVEVWYPWVPDFTSLTSVTNGSCTGVDLAVRTRNDNVSLQFTGYLDAPTNGTYTIYLNTDSRAFLRIHDASVIDADFGYTGGTEMSATINLQAGRHPIRLGYVRAAGGTPSLSLQWSGPGMAKRPIPSANLLRASAATSR